MIICRLYLIHIRFKFNSFRDVRKREGENAFREHMKRVMQIIDESSVNMGRISFVKNGKYVADDDKFPKAAMSYAYSLIFQYVAGRKSSSKRNPFSHVLANSVLRMTCAFVMALQGTTALESFKASPTPILIEILTNFGISITFL